MGANARQLDRKEAAAAVVWRFMAGFCFTQFQHGPHTAVMRELGLTPGHLKALMWLEPDRPLPMRAMADAFGVDASMVTWLVDRLEEKGLAERRALPSDRRVKTIALTELGERTRGQLAAAMLRPPQELMELDLESLEALGGQLEKLPSSSERVWWQQRIADVADRASS